MNWKAVLAKLALSAVISSGVAAVVSTVVFTAYVERVQGDLRSRRVWKERSVAELLGPMNIQLNRTRRAFDRYKNTNLYLEAKVFKVGNETIRNLLLEKSHLMPPELWPDADKLVEHYDKWLEEFEAKRGGKEPDLSTTFIYVGPQGYPFPDGSADRFQRIYRQYWEELYGPASPAAQAPGAGGAAEDR